MFEKKKKNQAAAPQMPLRKQKSEKKVESLRRACWLFNRLHPDQLPPSGFGFSGSAQFGSVYKPRQRQAIKVYATRTLPALNNIPA